MHFRKTMVLKYLVRSQFTILRSHCFRNINISVFLRWNSRSRSFCKWCHLMANMKIYKRQSVHFFALAVHGFEILTFHSVDLQIVRQGFGVQLLQLYTSMANVKILKIVWCIFVLTLAIAGKLTFQILDLEKVGQGHRIKLS